MESTGVIAEITALTLSKIGVSAIPALAKALREGGHGRRQYASLALVDIGDAAIPVLKEATEDEDRGVRWRAFNALARIGAQAIPFIADRLEKGDEATRLLIVEATMEELLGADTLAIQPYDTEGKSVIPHVIKLLDHKDDKVQFYARGVIEKIGLPSIPPLAEYLIDDCRSKATESNCIACLGGIMFGHGVKSSETAGAMLQKYTPALFARATRRNTEEVRWKYILLFMDIGIFAVPVLAQAWQNGTKGQREFSNLSMDEAFRAVAGSIDPISDGNAPHLPHLFNSPRNYDGPTSPDDDIFYRVNATSFADVHKIVLALEYKYLKIVTENVKEFSKEYDSFKAAISTMEADERDQASAAFAFRRRHTSLNYTISWVRSRALETIQKRGVLMLPHILEIARNGDDDSCLCALEALSIIDEIDDKVLRNNPDLLPVLIRFIKIPHAWYRRRALACASHIGEPLLPFLYEFLRNADELDRLAAVAAMGRVDNQFITHIGRLASDRDKAVAAFSSWYRAQRTRGL
jgi:HEAT repeat protein